MICANRQKFGGVGRKMRCGAFYGRFYPGELFLVVRREYNPRFMFTAIRSTVEHDGIHSPKLNRATGSGQRSDVLFPPTHLHSNLFSGVTAKLRIRG